LKLAVRTYNYAALPGNTLLNAEQHAAEIFHRAGIALVWVDRPVSREEIEKFPVCTQMANDPRAVALYLLPSLPTYA